MFTRISSSAGALASGSVMLTTAIVSGGVATADPNQDEQFLARLGQEQIPAVDNVPVLIARAHEICDELAGGASFDTAVVEEMNLMFNDNPSLHLVPGRVNRTAVKFVTAAVDIYCPSE